MANTESMVFFALIFSLTASSICIAWIVNDYAESPPCTYGTDCAPIALFYNPIPSASTRTGQDYTNNSGYDPNVTVPGGRGVIFGEYGVWEQQDGTGYVLTEGPGLLEGDPVLLLNGVTGVNGIYTVSYKVDNSPNGDFFIAPRYFGAGHTKLDIRITFKQDGIHVSKFPDYFLFPSDLYYQAYSGAQDTLPGGSIYIVTLDEVLNTVKVIKDGNTIFEHGSMPPWDPTESLSGQFVYHGAIGSREEGFTLVSNPNTLFTVIAPEDVSDTAYGNFWEGITGYLDKVIPGAGAVLEMLNIIARVVVWTLPEQIFPLWLNLLLIKTQAIALLYMGSRLARGGG